MVSRNHLGHTSIHRTWSAEGETAHEAGWAGVTGGVVGMLFRTAGAVAGAAIGGGLSANGSARNDYEAALA